MPIGSRDIIGLVSSLTTLQGDIPEGEYKETGVDSGGRPLFHAEPAHGMEPWWSSRDVLWGTEGGSPWNL